MHGSRFILVVRERWAGAPTAPSIPEAGPFDEAQLLAVARTWPLQWQMIAIDGAKVRLEAGHWGTAPLFLLADGTTLHGHWDAGHLMPLTRRNRIDPGRAARWLVDYATPYSTHTLFDDMRLLPERGRAEWDGSSNGPAPALTFTAPPPWPRPLTGTLCEGADPVEALGGILQASLNRWAGVMGGGFAREISGGLDSCLVTAIADRRADLSRRSYGLTLVGSPEAEEDQRSRRDVIVSHFALDDTAIAMAAHLPLAPGSARLEGHAPALPWEEGHYEAMDALLTQAEADGTRVMATGFGGDELFGLRPSERRALVASGVLAAELLEEEFEPGFLTPMARDALVADHERMPQAACSASAVEAAAFSAARYLRRGIWPVHPLCSPELVHFCARLPPEWRRARRIERAFLARQGVPKQVTHPRFRDDFSPAMARSMRHVARPLLERLFKAPALADLGIVDGVRLRQDYAAWCEGDRSAGATVFYAAAILELALSRARLPDR